MVLTTEQKAQVIAYRKAGMSMEAIGLELKVHRSSISRIIKAYEATGSLERKKGSGRKKILTERDIRQLKRLVSQQSHATLSDVQRDMTVKVSTHTLRRTFAHERLRRPDGKQDEAKK